MKISLLALYALLFNYQASFTMRRPINAIKQQAVQDILNANGDINQRILACGNERPIMALSDCDEHNDLLLQVLEKNPRINTKDYIKATFLHRAARNNALQNLIILMAYCTTVKDINFATFLNDRTANRKTALIEAVEHSSFECAKLLLKHGAQINLTTTKGWTAGHYLFKNQIYKFSDEIFKNQLDLVFELHNHGADFSYATPQNKTVYSLAEQSPAQHPEELAKKTTMLYVLYWLKARPTLQEMHKDRASFYSWLPGDVVWLIDNFGVGREVPR